jgi:hypothetical protein
MLGVYFCSVSSCVDRQGGKSCKLPWTVKAKGKYVSTLLAQQFSTSRQCCHIYLKVHGNILTVLETTSWVRPGVWCQHGMVKRKDTGIQSASKMYTQDTTTVYTTGFSDNRTSSLRWSNTGLSKWRPGFDCRVVRVGLVVDKEALGHIFHLRTSVTRPHYCATNSQYSHFFHVPLTL